jgi:hypothetical protein
MNHQMGLYFCYQCQICAYCSTLAYLSFLLVRTVNYLWKTCCSGSQTQRQIIVNFESPVPNTQAFQNQHSWLEYTLYLQNQPIQATSTCTCN